MHKHSNSQENAGIAKEEKEKKKGNINTNSMNDEFLLRSYITVR